MQLHCLNGRPFTAASAAEQKLLTVDVTCCQHVTQAAIEWSVTAQPHTAAVTFTAHKAGLYVIDVMYDGRAVRGSPFYSEFVPGSCPCSAVPLGAQPALFSSTWFTPWND